MVSKSAPVLSHLFKKKKVTTSNVLNSILNQKKKRHNHDTTPQDKAIDFKLKILKCDPINLNDINKHKKFFDSFESAFSQRFCNLEPTQILEDLNLLTTCNLSLNLTNETMNKIDKFCTIDNLTNESFFKMTKSDALTISKYPPQVQKLIILKILLPLGESKKVDQILLFLSKKISKFELIQLCNVVKLLKAEITFKDLTNLEIDDIFNSLVPNSVKYNLFLKHITNSGDLKLINQLFRFYSNHDIILAINEKVNLNPSFEELNFKLSIENKEIPEELIKYYIDTLIKSNVCSFTDLSGLQLPAMVIQKYSSSQKYSIDTTKIKRIPMKQVLNYQFNDLNKLSEYIKSLKGFQYNYIDPIEFEEFVDKLSYEKKSLLGFELMKSNVITDYSKFILGAEPLGFIRHGLSNIDSIERVLTMFDDKSIDYLLRACTDPVYTSEAYKKWNNPINPPVIYLGDESSIIAIFKDLKSQNLWNNTEIFKYLMENNDPFDVMNLIGGEETQTKYVSELLDSKFNKTEIDFKIDHIDMVELTFHFWKCSNCYNIATFSTKYKEYLSESKKAFQFMMFGLSTGNTKVLSNCYKFKVNVYPQISVSTIGLIRPESVLKYQRLIKHLTRFRLAKVNENQINELFNQIPHEYQPVLFKYLPQLVKRIPYSEALFNNISESCLSNNKLTNFICKSMGVDISEHVQYKDEIINKFDFNYLVLLAFHLLNKRNIKLDHILNNLKNSILSPKSNVDEVSFEIVHSISKSVNLDLKKISFVEGAEVENVNKMLKLSSEMGVLMKMFRPSPNFTIATLVKFTHIISLSPEFSKVNIKDILSFWFIMLNPNGGMTDKFMNEFGFWDLISEEEKTILLGMNEQRPDFNYDPVSFKVNDFNLFLRVLFYTGKFRELSIEEVNYFVSLINNVIKSDKLSNKEKSFAVHIGYTLISKNSSILFKFHRDLISELPTYKVYKDNINMILNATCNTKISDLDLILNQLVSTYKNNRYEIDIEVTNILNDLISDNELDTAEELYLKYSSICKHPKFKYEISNTMSWGKSLNKPNVGYKKGVVNTKVNGLKVKLFDKMLDD